MNAQPKPLLPEITVNGETVAPAAIAAEAQHHQAPKGKPGVAWRAAARALAIRALLLQEARRRGLEPAPRELVPGQVETDEEALIRQVLEVAVEAAAPSDEEVRAAYDAEAARFRAPSLYEAAHILIPANDPAARERAERILTVLRDDPAAFDRLAAEESACSSRAGGGRLGQLSTGDTVPEFEAALATLPEGTIAPAMACTSSGSMPARQAPCSLSRRSRPACARRLPRPPGPAPPAPSPSACSPGPP